MDNFSKTQPQVGKGAQNGAQHPPTGTSGHHSADASATAPRALWITTCADEVAYWLCVANNDKAAQTLDSLTRANFEDEIAQLFFEAATALRVRDAGITPDILARECLSRADESDRESDATAWQNAAGIALSELSTVPGGTETPGARAKRLAAKLARENQVLREWDAPKPLANSLLPVPTLSPALIPAPWREWVFDCAERMNAAPDYVAVSAIVGAASLIGNTISIRPKQRDDWRVVPNLWGALVGTASVKKSPAIAEALKPLSRLKATALEKWRDELKAWENDSLLDELDADALKKELKKRQAQGAGREELRALIDEQSSKVNAKPILKTYSVQDSTIEAQTNILANNPRGFLIERDELTGWLRSLDKQGHEQDRAYYLEVFNGTARNQQIERIGRGTIIVPHFTISILGTIQPLPFSKLIRGAMAGESADGFVARFQMLVYPDAPKKYVHVDRWPAQEAKSLAFAIFEALDTLKPESVGAQFEGDEAFLRFSDSGQTVFNEWLIDLENRLPQQSPLIEQHLAKYRSLMPSLALIFHLIDVVNRTAEPGAVCEKAAMMAAEWCDFLENHARRIYAMASDGATDGAELIAQRFGQLPNPFTAREVHQKRWAGLSDRDDVESALARLEDRGWIQGQSEAAETGRPTVRYWKHPAKASEK